MPKTPSTGPVLVIEIFLPLQDKAGRPQPSALFEAVIKTLTEKFGGVTSYARAPAEGRWKEGKQTVTDEIVVFEIMVEQLDRDWWRSYREELERQFKQELILIRMTSSERL
jgi:hypothetical protein